MKVEVVGSGKPWGPGTIALVTGLIAVTAVFAVFSVGIFCASTDGFSDTVRAAGMLR